MLKSLIFLFSLLFCLSLQASEGSTQQDSKLMEEFFEIVLYGSESQIKEFMKKNSIGINDTNADGVTALHIVSFWGRTDRTELLVKKYKANPNSQASDGRTPAMLAVEENHIETLKILARTEGIDLDIKNNKKETVLIIAVQEERVEGTEVLLKAGADPHIPDGFKRAPLTIASDKGDEGMVNLLLANGVKLDARGVKARAALRSAVKRRHTNVVHSLLKAGANPNLERVVIYEKTYLMEASEKGYTEIVTLLLQYGAKRGVEVNGKTDLTLAAGNGHVEVVGLFLKADSRGEITNSEKQRALQEAAGNGHTEIVNLLLEAGTPINKTIATLLLSLKGFKGTINDVVAYWRQHAHQGWTKTLSGIQRQKSKNRGCESKFGK